MSRDQMTEAGEKWLPVVGYEGWYSVSNRGRMRSEDRVVIRSDGRRFTYPGQMLACTERGGRATVTLAKAGSQHSKRVYRLVMESFVGPAPDGLSVLHWDDDCRNNRLENLRYGTQGENLRDAVRNGKNKHASRTHCNNRHEFTPENTRLRPGGARRCIACYRKSQRERMRRVTRARRAGLETAAHDMRGDG